MEGTTNPCLGACITATHTAQMNYDHAASGKGTVTKTACAGPPYDVSNEADRVKSFFAPDLSSLTHTTTLLCNLVFLFGG
jgi:hypothetical protein